MESKYVCKFCGKDTSQDNPPRYECRNCQWKKIYFGGLYWKTLERDNYSCIECGKIWDKKTKRVLNIHHKNHNAKDNRLENLETLCVNCHKKKRIFKCKDCKEETQANSAKQCRCIDCGIKHEKKMSYARQARFWKTRSEKKYNWYRKRYLNSISQ